MRTSLVAALVVVAAACSSGSADVADSTVAPVTTGSSASSAPVTAAPTSPPPTSPPSAPATVDPVVRIDVVVGVDDGPDRIESVTLGSEVVLTITNPSRSDEFHVHTLDLEAQVAAGETATFSFVADVAGTYEVESHDTGALLVVLEVG